MKTIFWPKREEVTEKQRKSCNEKLHNLHFDQIKENEMVGVCGTYGGGTQVHTGFLWGNLGKEASWNTCSIILCRNFMFMGPCIVNLCQ